MHQKDIFFKNTTLFTLLVGENIVFNHAFKIENEYQQ